MKKRTLSLIMVLAMLLSVTPISVLAEKPVAEAAAANAESPVTTTAELPVETVETIYPVEEPLAEIKSGTCGANLTWSLDTMSGVLTISGSGAMNDYSSTSDNGTYRTNAPWGTYYAFIKTVIIENGVTSIGERAFAYCDSLMSVTIPDSVTSIGAWAFNQTPWLTAQGDSVVINGILIAYQGTGGAITIPGSVTSIGDRAFYDCSSLMSVTIPNSVTSIGEGAFVFCRNLTSVTIGNSVTSIGYDAFRGCISLTSVTIGNSVTSIGNGAFSSCSNLTSVTIPDSVICITHHAFYGCSSLTSVTIGNSVTSIGSYAFYYCRNLTSVTIGNSVTYIGEYAFYGCSSLTSVTIPDSVTSIGIFAFDGCSSLTSVTIPNSVTSIGEHAFAYCGLTSITIPDSVTSIGNGAFYLCTNLTSVVVSPNNPYYDSRENCNAIIETATNTLICGCKNTVIPDSVTSIGNSAFYGCRSLTSVTIPDSVTSIGSYAFYRCTSFTSVTIPNSVTSIGGYAFYSCINLTSVTIPDSVTSIEWHAFDGCSSLTDVYYGGTEAQWNAIKIYGYNSPLKNATIHYNSAGPGSGASLDTSIFKELSPAKREVGTEIVSDGKLKVRLGNMKIKLGKKLSANGYNVDEHAVLDFSAGTISIYRASDDKLIWQAKEDYLTQGTSSDIAVSSTKDVLTVKPGNGDLALDLGTEYYVTVDAGFLKLEGNQKSPAITKGMWKFTTIQKTLLPYDLEELLQKDPTKYDNDLSLVCAKLSQAAYSVNAEDVVKYLSYLGYDDFNFQHYNYNGNKDGHFAFSVTTLPYYGNDADELVVIVAQGTTNITEALGDKYSASIHKFNGSWVYDISYNFYKEIGDVIHLAQKKGTRTKYLITGHSLGGAAANLTAAYLILESTQNPGDYPIDVRCYTFGAIDGITNASPRTKGFESIHNVYNWMDTYSPGQYGNRIHVGGGMGKFGQMEFFSYDYRTKEQKKDGDTKQFFDHINHKISNYVNAVENGTVQSSPLCVRNYTIVACPVDVDVYRGNELVGRVVNNVVDQTLTTIDIMVEDDVKFIFYPDNQKYDLKITAFDEGTMVVGTFNASGDGQATVISNVSLTPGKEMTATVGGESAAEDVTLFVVDETGEPVTEVQTDGTEVEIKAENHPLAVSSESGILTIGVDAPEAEHVFVAFYDVTTKQLVCIKQFAVPIDAESIQIDTDALGLSDYTAKVILTDASAPLCDFVTLTKQKLPAIDWDEVEETT